MATGGLFEEPVYKSLNETENAEVQKEIENELKEGEVETSQRVKASWAEDAYLDWDVIIRKYGYNAEKHEVVTQDGYQLNIWRVYGRFTEFSSIQEKRPPVLCWHGLGSSAYAFMNNGLNSPAFTLANEGYDVWLGNTRGNTFSRKHLTLDPSDDEDEFWDFSWEKAGIFDVSATVDFISGHTGFDTVPYIGHSQGTAQMFAALALYPQYFTKVPVFVALAPVTKLINSPSPMIQQMAQHYDALSDICYVLDIHEMISQSWPQSKLLNSACKASDNICEILKSKLASEYNENDDPDAFNNSELHYNQGASRASLLHFGQVYLTGRFQQWAPSFNKFLNIGEQKIMPEMDISKIKTPIALLFTSDDELTRDAPWIKSQLMDETLIYYRQIQGGHSTPIAAKDMSYFIDDIVPIIKKYQPLPYQPSNWSFGPDNVQDVWGKSEKELNNSEDINKKIFIEEGDIPFAFGNDDSDFLDPNWFSNAQGLTSTSSISVAQAFLQP